MKKTILALIAVISATCFIAAQENNIGIKQNNNYSRAKALQSIMDKYTAKDLPGISIAVYTESEGWWAGSSGYAKVETKTPMNEYHLQYLQSVSKTYMAVAILKLHEEGKIDLDAPITKYLPKQYHHWLKNGNDITVRMLLTHTSGVPEYISNPEYTATILLTPLKVSKMEEALECLKDDEPQYAPGTKYRYTNTNFALLALIADAITGNHATYINKNIFIPLGLSNTHYRNEKNYINNTNLVDSYWDLLNVNKFVNITPMQKANVASMVGDDGIICTPADAVKFMRGLMEGKLLKDSSLKAMEQFVKNDEGRPVYGLGLINFQVDSLTAYGHGGGGIGAGCALLYAPQKHAYIFLATNVGCVWDGPTPEKANAMKEEIWKTVLQ